MPEETQQVRQETEAGDGVVQQTRTVATSGTGSRMATGERVVYFVTGLVAALLGLRVVLSALGANRGNAFASLIYNLTRPFVAPFFGIFGYKFEYGVSHLEIETLFAIVIYALVGWGIAYLFRIARAH